MWRRVSGLALNNVSHSRPHRALPSDKMLSRMRGKAIKKTRDERRKELLTEFATHNEARKLRLLELRAQRKPTAQHSISMLLEDMNAEMAEKEKEKDAERQSEIAKGVLEASAGHRASMRASSVRKSVRMSRKSVKFVPGQITLREGPAAAVFAAMAAQPARVWLSHVLVSATRLFGSHLSPHSTRTAAHDSST